MNDQTDNGLSGQQIQQLRATAAQDLQNTVRRIGLRQKCLELAVQVCIGQPDKVVELARAMHEFAAFPATEIKIDVADLSRRSGA